MANTTSIAFSIAATTLVLGALQSVADLKAARAAVAAVKAEYDRALTHRFVRDGKPEIRRAAWEGFLSVARSFRLAKADLKVAKAVVRADFPEAFAGQAEANLAGKATRKALRKARKAAKIALRPTPEQRAEAKALRAEAKAARAAIAKAEAKARLSQKLGALAWAEEMAQVASLTDAHKAEEKLMADAVRAKAEAVRVAEAKVKAKADRAARKEAVRAVSVAKRRAKVRIDNGRSYQPALKAKVAKDVLARDAVKTRIVAAMKLLIKARNTVAAMGRTRVARSSQGLLRDLGLMVAKLYSLKEQAYDRGREVLKMAADLMEKITAQAARLGIHASTGGSYKAVKAFAETIRNAFKRALEVTRLEEGITTIVAKALVGMAA